VFLHMSGRGHESTLRSKVAQVCPKSWKRVVGRKQRNSPHKERWMERRTTLVDSSDIDSSTQLY
jgi:hypothetical protein